MTNQTDQNKETIRRIYAHAFGVFDDLYNLSPEKFAEALNDPNTSFSVWDLLDEVYDPNVIAHDDAAPGYSTGIDDLKKLLHVYHNAFPNHTYTLYEMVAEGNMVAYRWSVAAIHRGELFGIEAKGASIYVEGFTIARFNDQGQVAEVWQQWDKHGLFEQLGATDISGTVGD